MSPHLRGPAQNPPCPRHQLRALPDAGPGRSKKDHRRARSTQIGQLFLGFAHRHVPSMRGTVAGVLLDDFVHGEILHWKSFYGIVKNSRNPSLSLSTVTELVLNLAAATLRSPFASPPFTLPF